MGGRAGLYRGNPTSDNAHGTLRDGEKSRDVLADWSRDKELALEVAYRDVSGTMNVFCV